MRVTVIINPTSGTHGRHPEVVRRRAQLTKDLLSSIGVEHEVLITERAGHAYELARQAADRHISLVYAWGGDGDKLASVPIRLWKRSPQKTLVFPLSENRSWE
jgi:diacylglycerol kinase family enzyme